MAILAPRPPLLVLRGGAFLLAALLLLLSSAHLPLRARAQQACSATVLCPNNLCCSQWGFCGSTVDYCNANCLSQCSPPPVTASPPPPAASPPPPTPSPPPPTVPLKRMAYFVNWANMDPSLIPATSLTHVFYAFASINPTTYKVLPNTAVDVTGGLYQRFNTTLKTVNPAIKTLLSIGGASANTTVFGNAASSAATRSAFIQSAIALARTYFFDGLDIDWEYPIGKAALFSALVTDFRAAIESEAASSGKPKLLLTAAVAPDEARIIQSYNVTTVNKMLDFVNVMTYDLHGSWEAKTGMHTALQDLSSKLSVNASMDAWVSRGLARSKAMVGLAMYGRTWTLSSTSTGVGASASGAGLKGSISQDAGILFYKEIDQLVTTGGYTATSHTPSSCMYAWKGNQWVCYDNPSTIAKKVQFAKTQGYGGWFVWALSQDVNNALLNAAIAA
ncbi:unnamed protein product [Closterium sp. Naga37s-1]|nr:unnamed protein product [Closterium sp. Naga37s-1]